MSVPKGYTGAYQGAEWLRRNLEIVGAPAPSAFGLKVADILGQVWQGLYHLSESALFSKKKTKDVPRTDWSHKRFVEVVVHDELATWDYDTLTRLVVECHVRSVRLAVSGASTGYLRLTFHDRREWEVPGEHRFVDNHPGVEQLCGWAKAAQARHEAEKA